MIGRETVQRVLPLGFFRGPGQRLLGALFLCFPFFFSFSHSSAPLSSWPLPEASRDIPSRIHNPLTEVVRQADLLRCLHDAVPGERHDLSWECAHGKQSVVSAPSSPPAFLLEEGPFALPDFSWVQRTDQDPSPNDEPSRASPPPRLFPA
ncbi:MAG: hypothetical protein UBAL2_82410184a [Leptospirillum rubarum]|nr:MAG: hypothetical protein UBAL2_82410184a [Leptospirillum rubarum]